MGQARYEVNHPLPEPMSTFVAELRQREDRGEVSRAQVLGYLIRVSDAGWTLRAIANVFNDGVVIDTVRRPMNDFREQGQTIIPIPGEVDIPRSSRRPDPPPPPKPEPLHYRVPDDVGARMVALHALAREVRGTTPQDSPNRQASRDLTQIMAEERGKGASYVEIGRAAGVSWSAVKFRLGRYGYIDLPPSVAHTMVEVIATSIPRQRQGDQK